MSKNKNSHVNEQQDNHIKGNLRVNGQSLGESLRSCTFSRASSEMRSRMLVFLATFILILWEAEPAPAHPKARQFLPPVPGYIPVYIRTGDTPLEDINLGLAEAFHSYAVKQGRIANGRKLTPNNLEDDLKHENHNDISKIALRKLSRAAVPDSISR